MAILISNVQEADQVFDRFAVIQSRITKAKAALKARITKMQSEAEAAIAQDVEEAAALEAALKEFCEATVNRPFFSSPRKRKCENGSYGLQSSTEVETEDDFDAEAETVRLGIELCKRGPYTFSSSTSSRSRLARMPFGHTKFHRCPLM